MGLRYELSKLVNRGALKDLANSYNLANKTVDMNTIAIRNDYQNLIRKIASFSQEFQQVLGAMNVSVAKSNPDLLTGYANDLVRLKKKYEDLQKDIKKAVKDISLMSKTIVKDVSQFSKDLDALRKVIDTEKAEISRVLKKK